MNLYSCSDGSDEEEYSDEPSQASILVRAKIMN
jgi:hypothetical protein